MLLASIISAGQKEFDLDGLYKSAPQVVKLNVSNELLTAVPDMISKCSKIKVLNLSNNQITHLPEWFSSLANLEVLNISGNRNLNIKQAFDVIGKLPNLKELNASGCRMVYLPVAIRHLKSLRKVDLSNNFIPNLPPIFEEVLWTSLDISANCIDTLPASMVYMNTLEELNLSYSPASVNKHNYYLLEYLTSMRKLVLSGMEEIPKELSKLSFLKELILTNGRFNTLPESFKQLTALSKVDIRGCERMNVSDLVEYLTAASKKLRVLKIGHRNLKVLPYNMFKLKKLQRLYIDNSCVENLPSSFNKFKGKELYFRNCSFSTPELVFDNVGKARKLVNLEIDRCVFGHNNWKLKGSKTLQKLSIINCGLIRIPFQVSDFPELKKVKLLGNKLPKNEITWKIPKTEIGADYLTISYSKRELSEWRFTPLIPTTKRMIYSEIGDVFKLNSGTEITVDKMAFISTGNKAVTGDVELRIKEYYSPKDFSESNFPTFLPSGEVANVKYSVDIHAFHDGKEVYVNSSKPIVVRPQFNKSMALDKYYYLSYKNRWEGIHQTVNVCSRNVSREVRAVCPDFSDLPMKKNKLRVSKVHLRIKRNKRKKTLNFEIAPEYGYLENQINIFGDKIKGYPELKTYKNIKWRYVGSDLDEDLERLYFLSESAKKEKIDRKSSFYFYVLDIKDIRVFPNPKDDNYLIQFIQGRDTFSVEALPMLPILKAKKIQRWHRKKYRKYRKALEKRKTKWLEMDTVYLNQYSVFENELEKYRQLNLKSGYYFEPKKETPQSGQVLKVYKSGLYSLAIPLLLNNAVNKKPIYYLEGKRFYPRRVLVSNLTKKYHFWTDAKTIVKEKGIYQISIILNGEKFVAKWGVNNKVEFEKVK